MEKKMTKREKWMIIADVIADVQFEDGTTGSDFAEHEMSLLNRKKSSPNKATLENRAMNEFFCNEIVERMTPGTTYSIRDIQDEVESLNGLSTSKMVAILKIGISDGRIVKDKVKGKTVYSLA